MVRLFKQLISAIRLPLKIEQYTRDFSIAAKMAASITFAALPLAVLLLAALVYLSTVLNRVYIEERLDRSADNARVFFNQLRNEQLTWARLLAENRSLQLELLNKKVNLGKLERFLRRKRRMLNLHRLAVITKDGTLAQSLSRNFTAFKTLPAIRGSSLGMIDYEGRRVSVLDSTVSIRWADEEIGRLAMTQLLDRATARRVAAASGSDVFFISQNRLQHTSAGKVTGEYSFTSERKGVFSLPISLDRPGKVTENRSYDLVFVSGLQQLSDNAQFSMAVAMDNSSLRTTVLVFFSLVILTALVVITVASAWSYHISRGVGQAAHELSQGMKYIAAGNTDARLPVRSKDELGQMAGQFNFMVEEVSAGYRRLEKLNELGQAVARLGSVVELAGLVEEHATHILKAQSAVLYRLESDRLAALQGKDHLPAPDFSLDSLNHADDTKAIQWLKSVKKDHEGYQAAASTTAGSLNLVMLASFEQPYTQGQHQMMQSILRMYVRSHEILANRFLQADVQTAALIQKKLVPEQMPTVAGLEVFGMMDPARGLGGDYFDFIEDHSTSPPQLVIMIGDISGKGVAAGLVMVMVRTLLHSLIGQGLSTEEIVYRLNDYIERESENDRFMTLVLFKYNPARDRLVYTGGGHEDMMIIRQNKGVTDLDSGGTLIGALPTEMLEASGHISELELQLQKGDTVFLFTDGVTEARNSNREEFGRPRIAAYLEKNKNRPVKEIVEGLYQEVKSFCESAPRHDDITVLAFRRV